MRAAEVGAELARALGGEVALIHVGDAGYLADTGMSPPELGAQVKQENERLLAGFQERLALPPATLRFAQSGAPAATIVRAAKQWPADPHRHGQPRAHRDEPRIKASLARRSSRRSAGPRPCSPISRYTLRSVCGNITLGGSALQKVTLAAALATLLVAHATAADPNMARKSAAQRRAWNKGIELGQNDAFTPDQVKRIREVLARRGDQGSEISLAVLA